MSSRRTRLALYCGGLRVDDARIGDEVGHRADVTRRTSERVDRFGFGRSCAQPSRNASVRMCAGTIASARPESRRAARGRRSPKELARMATTVTRPRPRPQGRQALHLRLGRGHGRRRRRDEGPPRRQGRGSRRDDEGRPADAARLHDHDGRLQRLLRGRREAPRRALGRRPRGDAAKSSGGPARASATRRTRSS